MKITEIFSVDEDLKADPADCKIIATLSNGTIKTLCDVKAAPSTLTSLTSGSLADINSGLVPSGSEEPDLSCSCMIYQQARQYNTSLQSPFYLNELTSGGFSAVCTYNIYST